MKVSSASRWFVPIGLLALSFIPILAGGARLVQLSVGSPITPEHARFFDAPVPIIFHIVSITLYCILGAFQLSPWHRRRYQRWHRVSGWIVFPSGMVAALTGVWMAHFYAWPLYDGDGLYVIRIVVGLAMALFLCFGIASILRHDSSEHRRWMMRSHALGLGAGTQVLTHLPWFLIPSIRSEGVRTLLMGAGWFINLALVEWVLWRERAWAAHQAVNSRPPL